MNQRKVPQLNTVIFKSPVSDSNLARRMTSNLSNRPSCFMKSIDPNINNDYTYNNASGDANLIAAETTLQSLNLHDDIDDISTQYKSVCLLDDNERLLIKSESGFTRALNIEPNKKVKVVSIFGNTGEGKSYTLNHAFFDGEQIFKTSPSQTSCTLGVWAMYNPKLNVIFLDTEGLLGISKKEHQRTRMLLKILAVSDIIIYRTRAERLQRDMYTFLGGASKAYKEHFTSALKQIMTRSSGDLTSSGLGPGVIIFHETRYTDTLNGGVNLTDGSLSESPEDILRKDFECFSLSIDAFSFIKYIGVKSLNVPTCFDKFKMAVISELNSTEVRSARDPKYIYRTIKYLNDKFQSQITEATPQLYLPAFFTCQEKCQSCKNSCILSMGHKDDGEPHVSNKNCVFQHQFQNCVYLCKKCQLNGKTVVVKPSYQSITEKSWTSYLNYVWSGYIIECPTCGEIYRSRQHWYGNKNPEEAAVIVKIVHIWPGERTMFGSQNSAQKVIDGVSILSEAVASVGAQPTKAVTDWVTDQIAPSYWRQNYAIKECFKCKVPFEATATKHHCRKCGEGFCESCSSREQPVPSRGWLRNVRVCDDCYVEAPQTITADSINDQEIKARQIGETVASSISIVKSVLNIPKDFIKDNVRPSYWVPDIECLNCSVCNKIFGPAIILHHCRDCGKGVCNDCSNSRKPVPLRGWDKPVRVCDNCLG